MKSLLISTALAASLAMPALAQDAPVSPFQTETMGPSVAASDLIGARIYASEMAVDAEGYAGVQDGWNDIGEINDVILTRDGSVDAVLVDIGGFLGIGERQVAVDMAALRFVQDNATNADDWFLVLQADRAMLDSAPEWAMPGGETRADATHGMEDVPVVNEAIGEQTATAPDTARTLPEGYAAVAPETLTAEQLTGASVHDSTDASIATISDLVLTSDGQVTDVVLDVGGFLGIGARSVAIPMERLTIAMRDGGDVTLWVDMTRDELEELPEHTM